MNPGTETAQISFDPQKTDIKEINQTLEPLGYSLSDLQHSETMKNMEHDHSAHNMNHESMETE